MKKFFPFLFIFLLFVTDGCSLFSSSDDEGGIAVTLPESPGRSVHSEGATYDAVSYYVVRVRKDDEVVQEEKASPGSTVTVDRLFPGEYTVAVLGVGAGGIVEYYGRSPSVQVMPGETSATSLTLKPADDVSVTVSFYFVDSSGEWNAGVVSAGTATFSVTAKGGGISHTYVFESEVMDSSASSCLIGSDGAPKKVENFLEPGISYNFSAKASRDDFIKTYAGSYTTVVDANGETYLSINLK